MLLLLPRVAVSAGGGAAVRARFDPQNRRQERLPLRANRLGFRRVLAEYRELTVDELSAAATRHRVRQKRVVQFAKRQFQRLRPAGKHHLSAERVAGAGARREGLASDRLESKPRGSGQTRPCFV